MTISAIKAYKPSTGLEKATKAIILSEVSKDYTEAFFEDLLTHGCISGMIGDLIYYADTSKFFNKHRDDINSLLSETIDEIGAGCPSDVFGDKFDKKDSLILEQNNQNLLAWFAFEETSRRIASELGFDF